MFRGLIGLLGGNPSWQHRNNERKDDFSHEIFYHVRRERYSTLGKSGQRTPHGSFLLRAIFFGQSAETSASRSATLPSRPRCSINRAIQY
jgi:hypothetical protein